MTQNMTRQMINKSTLRFLPLLGVGAVAAALSGCGGASTSSGAASVATPNSGPVIYGVNALALASGGATTGETSGLSFTPTEGTTDGAIVGAFAYKTTNGAGPLPAYQADFPNGVSSDGVVSSAGVPLGFAPEGSYYGTSAAVAALPTNYTGTLTFGAYISTGALNTKPVDLNTSSVVLTSSEDPTFTEPLTFDPNFGTGVLAQTQYKTAAFPMPAFLQTTGLHDLHTTVADVAGQSSTTDFVVATVAPTNVALFLQSLTVLTPATATAAATTTTTAIAPGDTVTIDGGAGVGVYPAGYTPEIADAQGSVVLFTAPGTHTVTETDPTGALVQTETFTLDPTTAGTTILTPPNPDGAPAASARPLVIHPAARRSARR